MHGCRQNPKDLYSEDGISTRIKLTEYTHLGVKIIRDIKHEDYIIGRINKGGEQY